MSSQTNKINKSKSKEDLLQLPTEELRKMLAALEEKHDKLSLKNEELANQANDLRKVIKCVDSERNEEIEHILSKKKDLERQIDSSEGVLKISHKNNSYQAMVNFKHLSEE